MIALRPATPDDAAALQALYAHCMAEAAWLPESAKRDPILAEVTVGEVLHLAETAADGVVGFVSVQVADAFIHHLYVAPASRGRRVGRSLLDALQAWLPRPWRLKCVSRNREALGFYRRLGWEALEAGESAHGPYLLLGFPAGVTGERVPEARRSGC